MCRRSAPFRLLSISRKQSARYCASADKLGNGAGNGFGLLQQQKVSRTRQVDNPDALAELLAERVAIARRSRFIIEPPDHDKRGCMPRRPAFRLRKYFWIRRRRQPTRPQHGDAIDAVHLDFRSVAKACAE